MGEIIVAVFGIYLILQMIIGYRRGLIKSMLNLASWILTFAIAYKGAAYFKEIVIQNVPEIQGNDCYRSNCIYDCIYGVDDRM